MTHKAATILTAVIMALSACMKPQHAEESLCPDQNTLLVNMGSADTKAYIDGVRTLLHSEDLFSVFFRSSLNEKWAYTGDDGSVSGNLTACSEIERSNSSDKILAVYPWSESASISDGVITTVLPQVQYFAESSYGRGAAVLAASATSYTLNFRYASGFVCLRLTGDAQIKDIELAANGGESLSGTCTIDMNGSVPVLDATGSSSIILRNRDFSPVTAEGTKDFIFSAAPGRYESGISFDITYTTGQVQRVKVTGPFTIRAGEIASPIESVAQPLVSIEANFHTDGQTAINPFAVSIDRNIIPGTTGSTSESSDMFLSTDAKREHPFRFYIGTKDVADNLRITRSGFSIGGTPGDYILLPGIEGMRLTAVLMTANNCTVSINRQEEVTLTDFAPTRIDVTGSMTGQACRIEFCTGQIAKITNITLYYDTAL